MLDSQKGAKWRQGIHVFTFNRSHFLGGLEEMLAEGHVTYRMMREANYSKAESLLVAFRRGYQFPAGKVNGQFRHGPYLFGKEWFEKPFSYSRFYAEGAIFVGGTLSISAATGYGISAYAFDSDGLTQ